jgi:ABC-2 type transport system ATP-binding protein
MWKIVKELAHSGVTVFLTTQYLEEADSLADHIAILHNGKIVAQGSATQLKKLLPHGHIELHFRHESEITLAGELLTEYNISVDRENLTLNIVTDGSVRQMMDIFVRSLLMYGNVSDAVWIAIFWCVGIWIFFHVAAIRVYNRRIK